MADEERYVTRLVWFAVAGQVVFVLGWLLAGALESGYDHAEQYVSELGAETAENPWLANGVIALFGLTFVALGAALERALPRRPRRRLPVLLFALAGLGLVVAALAPLECETTISELCDRRFDDGDLSSATYVHAVAGFAAQIALLLTPFAVAWALWPRPLARLPLLAGLSGLVIFALFWLGGSGDDQYAAGFSQRLGFGVIHAWSGIVAIALLIWARTRPDPLPTAGEGPLEPSRFLGASLDGAGEMAYSPWTRLFRLPRRFDYRWRVEYEGSAIWLVHQVLEYEGDRLRFDRTVLARPLSETAMHLTADDMPGGGRADLFPGGLQLQPTWFLTPWWNFPWPMLGHGRLLLDGEDALRGQFRFALFGFLPFARMQFRLARSERPA